MVLSNQACSSEDRILALLHGELGVAEERELQKHLADCEDCQLRLEDVAGERSSWIEAREFLVEDPWRSSIAQKSLHRHDQYSQSPSTSALQIQQVLDVLCPTDDPEMLGRIGGYEVSGVIGSGGMGVVLKAHDRSLDRVVAIKVLSPHLASSGAARQRFEREAKAVAGVLHPNVIAVHGVSNDSVLPFLVMPYMRGATLQKRIDAEGALPVADILRIGMQVAAGLAAAHEQGLIHRDIKPANILLEDGVERVTITDFGLARAVDDASITRTGVIAGTPHYMSPEQARGECVDRQSDLFSLGSVLYSICTCRPPFRAETTYGILRQITDDEPRSIREINPEIPDWLCVVVERLHKKLPSQRYPSATYVAELLEQCLAHLQTPSAGLPAQLLREKRRLLRKRMAFAAVAFVSISVITTVATLWNSDGQVAGFAEKKAATPAMEPNPREAISIGGAAADVGWHDNAFDSPMDLLDQAIQLEREIQDSFLPLEEP